MSVSRHMLCKGLYNQMYRVHIFFFYFPFKIWLNLFTEHLFLVVLVCVYSYNRRYILQNKSFDFQTQSSVLLLFVTLLFVTMLCSVSETKCVCVCVCGCTNGSVTTQYLSSQCVLPSMSVEFDARVIQLSSIH